jgi:hypothetical protein
VQFDPCLICGRPALERYAIARADLESMTEERLWEPLCEPHRQWLDAAGRRGREVNGALFRLTDTP